MPQWKSRDSAVFWHKIVIPRSWLNTCVWQIVHHKPVFALLVETLMRVPMAFGLQLDVLSNQKKHDMATWIALCSKPGWLKTTFGLWVNTTDAYIFSEWSIDLTTTTSVARNIFVSTSWSRARVKGARVKGVGWIRTGRDLLKSTVLFYSIVVGTQFSAKVCILG